MIAAVLDTNVLVSGIGWPDSPPGRAVDALVAGEFVAISTPALLGELQRVLDYPKLQRVAAEFEEVVLLLEQVIAVVEPVRRLSVLDDEPDNRLLEAAGAAGAEFLVTGDRGLLELELFEGTRIVTPRQFIEALSA